MQMALGVILVAVVLLFVTLTIERARTRRTLHGMSQELKRLAEGTDPEVPVIRAGGPFRELASNLETLVTRVGMRDAAALEAMSTNRLMARELKRLTRLLDGSSEALIALDNAGKVICANQACAPHLSVPPEATNGKRIAECLRDHRIVELIHADPDDATDTVRSLELPPHPEFGVGHMNVTVANCLDDTGDAIGQLVAFRDVDEVKTLRRQQIQFVEHLAEEFRVPLTAIRGHAQTLAASPAGVDGAVAESSAAIRDEGQRLSLLLDNLVILSQMECGATKPDVDAVPLKALIEAVVDAVRPQCEKKSLTIAAELPERLPTLYADESLLRIAFMNLLVNAVQYTADEGTITVESASHAEDIQLSIRDTGCGIDDTYFDSIFQKFFRCPASDHTPGSGIGLSVARQIIRSHGGDIEVSSHVGHGSQFTIILPRALLQAPGMDKPAA